MLERLMFWRKKPTPPPPPVRAVRCDKCRREVHAWHRYESGQVLCSHCAARYK